MCRRRIRITAASDAFSFCLVCISLHWAFWGVARYSPLRADASTDVSGFMPMRGVYVETLDASVCLVEGGTKLVVWGLAL